VWRIVRVPSGEEEDRRQLHRALTTVKRDRTRVINQGDRIVLIILPPL
jgi:hypothetical protein